VLGGILIWYVWIIAEPVGGWLMSTVTAGMDPASPVRSHLLGGAAQMRPLLMGLILLCVLRFAPRGLIPERTGR
jgi:branched-chain amino acid transport system permease protein